ncbi:MAG: recombinase RecT [Alistipes sp.]|nr:recombinase RecT [Alistipes sp.]
MEKNNAVQVRPQSGLRTFNDFVKSPNTQDYLASVLGERKGSFLNNLTALVGNNKMLQECQPLGLMYTALKATALNLPLDPNLGLAYVLPYRNNRTQTTEAQFQIGYKGFVQLAIRSGQFRNIAVRDVRDGEIVSHDFLTNEPIFKQAENREALPIIGYVAYFRLLNGFEKSEYWSLERVEEHAKKYSQSYGSRSESVRNASPWATNREAMAQKTVLKSLLSHWAPLSVEMAEAQRLDQISVDADQREHYLDNEAQGDVDFSDIEDLSNLTDEKSINEALVKGQITPEVAASLRMGLES